MPSLKDCQIRRASIINGKPELKFNVKWAIQNWIVVGSCGVLQGAEIDAPTPSAAENEAV
jgi:hypothetical protein